MVPPINAFFLDISLRSPKKPNNNISQFAIKNHIIGWMFSKTTEANVNNSSDVWFLYFMKTTVETSIIGVDNTQSKYRVNVKS